MWKIADAQDSWATDAGQDLLASIVVSAQIRLTFGFGFRPKVPPYFLWHIRFRPNVVRHFRPTFGFGWKWNFHFGSTSNSSTSQFILCLLCRTIIFYLTIWLHEYWLPSQVLSSFGCPNSENAFSIRLTQTIIIGSPYKPHPILAPPVTKMLLEVTVHQYTI